VTLRTAVAAAAAVALGWAGTSQASASRHVRAARHGRVQAFLLTSSPDSLVDLRAHAEAIGVVYPTYFECRPPSGGVSGHDIPAIDEFARSRGIVVMPRFNCQDGAVVHRLLTEAPAREAVLARLASLARRPAFAGLCLDLENDGPGDRDALSSFVTALAQRLHPHNRKLTVVADGVTHEGPGAPFAFYDDRALAAVADNVFVMAWGTHWAGSGPGALSTLAYVGGVVRFLQTLPDSSRFVVGAPMYGLDWAGTGTPAAPPRSGSPTEPASAYEYAHVLALSRSVRAQVTRDPLSGELTFSYTGAGGVSHQVWYMDAQAILGILRVAHAGGFGIGLWRLGTEDQSLWSAPLMRAQTPSRR
jgi:spore germination protein YaaH